MFSAQFGSDFHFDFYQDKGESFIRRIMAKKSGNVFIIAGDGSELVNDDRSIGNFHARNVKLLCDNYEHVIEIVGNHTYYRSSPSAVHEYMSLLDSKISNYHWLHNSSIVIDGVIVSGTPLWFRNDPMNVIYEKYLNDFRIISDFKPWVYDENQRAIDFIKTEGHKSDILVTHHLPSSQSIEASFRGDALNRFYCCDILDKELVYYEKLPKVWIHGHSHSSFDGMTNGVRVVRNPAGYKTQLNKSYNMKATIVI